MDRRRFIGALTASAISVALGDRLMASTGKKQIAFTFDDPTTLDYPGYPAAEIDRRLRAWFNTDTKAALFVCGMRVDSDAGRRLVKTWKDEGHVVGNHSYSHLFFPSAKVSLERYVADAEKGGEYLGSMITQPKYFRFPFFKEGDTVEKRDGMRQWLVKNGYRNGRATVDASDWAIDGRMRKRLEQDAKADLTPYRDFYVEHILDRSRYYEELSRKAWGKPVRHTVLLHHRLSIALFLGDLMSAYKKEGWEIISASRAYEDPIYEREPDILPAGESLVWALAKEKGVEGLRYPGEDDVYENPEMDRRKL